MGGFVLRIAPRPSGVFRFGTLEIRHRALCDLDAARARARAQTAITASREIEPFLAGTGLDLAAFRDGAPLSQWQAADFTALADLLFAAELGDLVIEGWNVEIQASEGEAPEVAPFEPVLWRRMLTQIPGLGASWTGHAARTLAEAAEGNGYTLPPAGTGAAAANTAGPVIH